MCGNGFSGPPNTTNATKHLRCKHKNEYLLYFDLLEGAKQRTFLGDVHQSIREVAFQILLIFFSFRFLFPSYVNLLFILSEIDREWHREEDCFHFTECLW